MTKWWDEPNPRDAPLVERPTAFARRKPTRRWCRGKVGVPHVTEVVRHHQYEVPPFADRACGWTEWRFVAQQRWSCMHVVRCASCGKITEHRLDLRCPDYDGSPNPGNVRDVPPA